MLDKTLNVLKNGQFILLHDSSDKENEVNMLDTNEVLHHSKIYA